MDSGNVIAWFHSIITFIAGIEHNNVTNESNRVIIRGLVSTASKRAGNRVDKSAANKAGRINTRTSWIIIAIRNNASAFMLRRPIRLVNIGVRIKKNANNENSSISAIPGLATVTARGLLNVFLSIMRWLLIALYKMVILIFGIHRKNPR